MKKFVAIFLTFILIFSFTLPSYANVFDGLKEVDPSTSLSPADVDTNRGTSVDSVSGDGESGAIKGNPKKVWDIFNKIFEIALTPITNLIIVSPTIDGAIWAEQDFFQLSFFDANPSGFAGSVQGVIGSLYNALRYMVAAIYVVILVYLGIRMILSSIGKQKAHYKELLKYWLTGLILLFAFHWIMAFAIWTSDTLTQMFADTGRTQIAKLANDIGPVRGLGEGLTGSATPKNVTEAVVALILKTDNSSIWALFSVLVKLILLLALWAFGLFISITYIKRLFTVALLLVLFPMVVLSYVFDKIGDRRAQTFGIWMKEFMTNVFVQPIHALLLLIIAFLLDLEFIRESPVIGPIIALMLLGLLPIGEKQIKQLFQISSNMGAGAGGLGGAMHTLAHASQIIKNTKELASKTSSSLQERMAKMSNKADARKLNKEAKKELKDVKSKIKERNPNLSKAELNKKVKAAQAKKWESIKNSDKYKTAMKNLGQKPGSFRNDAKAYGFWNTVKKNGKKSLHDTWNKGKIGDKQNILRGMSNILSTPIKGAGKTVAFAGKHLSVPLGMSFGLAKGMISSGDLGELVTNSATGFATGTAAGLMARSGFAKILSKPSNVPQELKDAEILLNAKFSSLSLDDKQQLAIAVGLGKNEANMITEDNRAFITKRLERRKELAQRGLNYKGAYGEAFDDDASSISRIQSGRDPYTNEPLDASDYESKQTKDALYMKSKKTGQIFRLKGYGNKDASDSIQDWYNNDIEHIEELSNNRVAEARARVNKLAGDGIGAANSAFATQKQYDDCLSKEILAAQKSAHAQVSTVSSLVNSSYNIMETAKPDYYATSSASFRTVEVARNTMSENQWSDVCAKYSTYADNLTGGTLSANEITNKVVALEQAKLPFSLESVCQSAGCDYNTFKQGGATEAQVAQIAQAVQTEYKNAPADIQQTVMANVIDMESKTTASIQTMVDNGTLSKESINMAVSAATNGRYTDITEPTKLNEFLANTTIETQNNMLHFANNHQRVEVEATPYAPTIVTAQKNGKVTTPVMVSNPPSDITQIFGACENMPVQTEVFRDTTTGTSKIKISSVESPSKYVIMDTDIDSSDGTTKLYAGDLSLDANGNILLNRSEDEVAVYPTQEEPKETFGDITFDQLQATGTTSKKFSLVRNEDICIVLDETNNVIMVRQGLESIGKLKQPKIFYVEADGNDLVISGPTTDSHDTVVRSRCKTYGFKIQKSNPDVYSLINRLFGK